MESIITWHGPASQKYSYFFSFYNLKKIYSNLTDEYTRIGEEKEPTFVPIAMMGCG
jgi:hypothetical protein